MREKLAVSAGRVFQCPAGSPRGAEVEGVPPRNLGERVLSGPSRLLRRNAETVRRFLKPEKGFRSACRGSRMTLRTRLVSTVVCMAVVAMSIFFYTWTLSRGQEGGNVAVNLAGRQRMLAQKIAKDALAALVDPASAPAAKDRVAVAARVFEATQTALASGGKAPASLDPSGASWDVPAPGKEAARLLEEAGQAFAQFRKTVDGALSGATAPAKAGADLTTGSDSVVAAMNKAVLVMQDHGEHGAQTAVYAQIVGGLVIFALALAGGIGIVRHVTRPVKAIHDFAMSQAAGDYSAKLEGEFHAELAETADAIRTMTARLIDALGFSQGVLAGIKTPFVVVDAESHLKLTNQALMDILQYEGNCEDHYGENVAHFFYGDASRKTVLSDAMAANTSIIKEVITTGKKGAKRNILIAASPLFNNVNGKLMGALCLYTDLTELRAKEAEIQHRNDLLAQAANEAESISNNVVRDTETLMNLFHRAGQGAMQQRERLEGTSAAIAEIDASVNHVAVSANQAAQGAEEAGAKAVAGEKMVTGLVAAMGRVQNLADGLRENMGRLGRQAEDIGRVLTVISDIADQTNLLALNAAIEAARAGEAGRGFAVVADEVRKLAEKTMTATKEVGEAIESVQSGARTNVEQVDAAAEAVTETSSLARGSGEALSEIVRLVSDTSQQVRAIALGAEEQAAALRDVTEAVSDISRVAAETSDGMHESAHAVQGLMGQTGRLRGLIDGMADTGPAALT